MSESENPLKYDAFNPLLWADIGLTAVTIDAAREELRTCIEREVHVNSLLLIVGGQLPSDYREGAGLSMAPASADHVSGMLVSHEWMAFLLEDGNAKDDPMIRRMGSRTRPMFWWEDSDLHRSLEGQDRRFATHYLDHRIRLGMLDANVDTRAQRLDSIALDSHAAFSEFKAFERHFGHRIKLAFAWFSEARRLREMTRAKASLPLAPRERECLKWASVGLTSAQIAERLVLSDATVNEYVGSAIRRLGASTRVQACARATLIGEISL